MAGEQSYQRYHDDILDKFEEEEVLFDPQFRKMYSETLNKHKIYHHDTDPDTYLLQDIKIINEKLKKNNKKIRKGMDEDTGETCYILVNHYNCRNINSCTNCKISSRPSENKRRREVERSREKSLLQPYWSHLSLEYVKIQTFSIYFLGRRYGILWGILSQNPFLVFTLQLKTTSHKAVEVLE